MRIYSMTATFGKLENQTLTFQPGLNVLSAPNEWGKTTWCAFLVNMLYGMETRVHSTKNALADKERYQPWSGSPMSGRIDLNWGGRDITIQRRSKGRVPFGDFRAYETQSGLTVGELNGTNCGEMLLGVERDVFVRSAFLRLSDLPVTDSEALRRRLNALVTTGSEKGEAELLNQRLKELKNRCRYNRTGLLPQAEAQAAQIESKLRSVRALNIQAVEIRQQQEELNALRSRLENHQDAMEYAAAEMDHRRIAEATEAADAAKVKLRELEEHCAEIPSREESEALLERLQNLQQAAMVSQLEDGALPQISPPPTAPKAFRDVPVDQVIDTVREDITNFFAYRDRRPAFALMALAFFFSVLGIVLLTFQQGVFATVLFVLCLIFVLVFLFVGPVKWNDAKKLQDLYGAQDPEDWVKTARNYVQAVMDYEAQQAAYDAAVTGNRNRRTALQEELKRITAGESSGAIIARNRGYLSAHNDLDAARTAYQQAARRVTELQALIKPGKKPAAPDPLEHSKEETGRMLVDTNDRLQQLQLQLGQCMGQAEQLGQEESLQRQLAVIKERIRQLEDTYAALNIAMETLSVASADLQRRFAPRISKQTEQLMAQLTDGRYDRILLGEDFRLCLGSQKDEALLSAQWRSDGTVDQLYLALRLAVARELIPNAPMILDDALVRFDDKRLRSAMEVLKKEAQSRQVILFTCQGRETQE